MAANSASQFGLQVELRRRVGGHDKAVSVGRDRKSTRLNSSHSQISYAVFCLKKKKHYLYARLNRSSEPPTQRSMPSRLSRRHHLDLRPRQAQTLLAVRIRCLEPIVLQACFTR